MVAKIPGQRLNFYLSVVYRSQSTDDRVFDCLCEAMGSIQSVDPKAARTPNAISLECEKVGELASKLMRTQNARSVRVAAIEFIINAYYYRENYVLFANTHI